MKLTQEKLESILCEAVDILKGDLSSEEYIDYISELLILKRINDQFSEEKEEKKKALKTTSPTEDELEKKIENPSTYETFYIPKEARWENLKALDGEVGEALNNASKEIAKLAIEGNHKSNGSLTITDFDKSKLSDEKIAKLVKLLSTVNLADKAVEDMNVLDEADQYLQEKFGNLEC